MSEQEKKVVEQEEQQIDGQPLSKKAQKKAEEKAKKALEQAERQKILDEQKALKEQNDPSKQYYGEMELVQSQHRTERKFTNIEKVDKTLENEIVLIRARVHNVRGKGNMAFLVLRDSFFTIQALCSKDDKISKQMLAFISSCPKESIVDVYAKVVIPPEEIKSCTQKVELQIQQFHIVSKSHNFLPFQIDDASRKINKKELDIAEDDQVDEVNTEEQKTDDNATKETKVNMKARLDGRIIDLRTNAKQAIFRLSSGVGRYFREFCYDNDFTEIHTPKLIGGSSEGGANVFKFNYFNKEGCLAQSPQLYKQMLVMSDFKRVFEVGPVFRAENSMTHRHLCEFTGLDIEMAIDENYHELMDMAGELFCHIFKQLEKNCAKELEEISKQYEFEPFKFKYPVVKLTFAEGVALLKENGIEQDINEDLSTVIEKQLGALVKTKYDTDFYFLYRYPINARPFYTMPCKDDPNFTNSYDFFMRGEEITSGAQRIHDPELMKKQAILKGLDVATIQDYIDSFKYGAYPHGGCGIGLERVVMLYCDLRNIRNTSLFPRDPKRLQP